MAAFSTTAQTTSGSLADSMSLEKISYEIYHLTRRMEWLGGKGTDEAKLAAIREVEALTEKRL